MRQLWAAGVPVQTFRFGGRLSLPAHWRYQLALRKLSPDVVQCQTGRAHRLNVIDGLGWPDLIPLAACIITLARLKARQRPRNLDAAITELLARREQHGEFGIHGWLSDAKRGC